LNEDPKTFLHARSDSISLYPIVIR